MGRGSILKRLAKRLAEVRRREVMVRGVAHLRHGGLPLGFVTVRLRTLEVRHARDLAVLWVRVRVNAKSRRTRPVRPTSKRVDGELYAVYNFDQEVLLAPIAARVGAALVFEFLDADAGPKKKKPPRRRAVTTVDLDRVDSQEVERLSLPVSLDAGTDPKDDDDNDASSVTKKATLFVEVQFRYSQAALLEAQMTRIRAASRPASDPRLAANEETPDDDNAAVEEEVEVEVEFDGELLRDRARALPKVLAAQVDALMRQRRRIDLEVEKVEVMAVVAQEVEAYDAVAMVAVPRHAANGALLSSSSWWASSSWFESSESPPWAPLAELECRVVAVVGGGGGPRAAATGARLVLSIRRDSNAAALEPLRRYLEKTHNAHGQAVVVTKPLTSLLRETTGLTLPVATVNGRLVVDLVDDRDDGTPTRRLATANLDLRALLSQRVERRRLDLRRAHPTHEPPLKGLTLQVHLRRSKLEPIQAETGRLIEHRTRVESDMTRIILGGTHHAGGRGGETTKKRRTPPPGLKTGTKVKSEVEPPRAPS